MSARARITQSWPKTDKHCKVGWFQTEK